MLLGSKFKSAQCNCWPSIALAKLRVLRLTQLCGPWNSLTLLVRKQQKSCRNTCTWKKFKTSSLLLTVSAMLNSLPRSQSWLRKLGLEPHQHDSVLKAVVYSVYERSSDGVKQEQLASLTEGITERLQANEHELESDILHDAAILEKRYIYVFNLDNEPASCNVYPLLPQDNFKWHQKISGLMKALNIPVGAMANLLPPHLLVMRMLEVVKEALVHSEVIINCAEQ
ncbi:hypothetical protein WJX77_011907 [Trebouxia sp. C0004]